MEHLTPYQLSIRAGMSTLCAQPESPVEERLRTIAGTACDFIRGASHADVILIHGDRRRSVSAPSSRLVSELSSVQVSEGEGPCIQAAFEDVVIRVPDLNTEKRWPAFTAAALQRGVRSVMAFRLHQSRDRSAALGIFGCAAGAFNIEDEALGSLLAAHASIVLSRYRSCTYSPHHKLYTCPDGAESLLDRDCGSYKPV
ncbi:GAF domain-containing protein [Mycobacterium sp. C31M]